MRSNAVFAFALLTILLAARPVHSSAEVPINREYQIKAAYLVKFLNFVEGVRTVGDASTICVIGGNVFGGTLTKLVAASTRAVDVRAQKTADGIDECSVVFVHGRDASLTESVLRAARGSPILTVSDTEGFASKGGIIELIVEGSRVRFIINHAAAREDGLRISSKLLALASELVRSNESSSSDSDSE